MKKLVKNHKVFTTIVICAIIVVVGFFAVSHGVYNRSFMATVVEMYMTIIDREAQYAIYADTAPALIAQARAVEKTPATIEKELSEAEPYLKPASVKMDVPYYYSYENGMQVYHFNEEAESDTLIVYYPGGGYINEPLKYHWKIINSLCQELQCNVLMPVYPKAPEYTCDESYDIVMKFYFDCVNTKDFDKLVFMGDSSGGGMALVMAQLLRDEHPDAKQPDEIILLSPWMDVSMENEEIAAVDPHDPMLDSAGVAAVGRMWIGDRDVHDPLVSPIYGTFENLGRITIFAGTRDILCPDDIKFSEILTEQGIDHICVVEEGLNHPYVLFPIPEAKDAQKMIVDIINGEY